MRLAVTGGTGFIGQWLLRLYGQQHEWVVPCLQQEAEDAQRSAAWVQGEGIRYLPCDFTAQALQTAFKGVDAIIHLAAGRPLPGESRLEGFLPNIALSEQVFLGALQAGVTNIVSISSRSVYGLLPTPWAEDMQPRPIGGYSIAKYTVELLADALNQTRGAKIKSLRLAQVMGVGERSGYLITTLLSRAAQGLPLQVYGTGAGRREYLYVKDACLAMMMAAQQPQISGVFNTGTGHSVSVLELAQAISHAYGGTSPVYTLADKPEDLSVSHMDVSLAKQLLGYQAAYSLADALLDIRLHAPQA